MKDLLQRELPGARITDLGGIKVFIRGDNFNNCGFEGDQGDPGAALFVLDGMVVPSIDHLQPRDVKSTTLIKDGSSHLMNSPDFFRLIYLKKSF